MTEQGADPLLPRCLMVLDEPFYEQNGRLYSPWIWWRFGDVVAQYTEKYTAFVPLARGRRVEYAQPVEAERMDFVQRFFYRNTEEYYRRLPANRGALIHSARKLLADYDVVILRMPSPIGYLLAQVAWQLGKPTILFVAGNVITQTRYANARGLWAWFARRIARHLRANELRVAARSALVAVWGEELLPAFSKMAEQTVVAAAPNMRANDIQYRDDTCTGEVIRIVRIAKVTPSKAIEHIIQAVARLRRSGRNVHLDHAGFADDPSYQARLNALVSELKLEPYVRFHGSIQFGPALFDLYRSADIHVVSSLGEGLPRCIVEGRAFGLPTVATRVGGIPAVVHHEEDGLLIEPGSTQEIVRAVERLVEEGEFRRRIIRAGYRSVETHTADFQARRLATLMARALCGQSVAQWATDPSLMPDMGQNARGPG
ncbi:MAG: glycosyltransferase family 4 protein [Phycisphaerae bacterium]|nr:glycosyltransferase family 4 protein [Phycisphaerae bacterium]